MVRAAEGLHVRPPAADAGGSAIDGDAVDSTAPPPDEAGAQGNLELPAERRRWNSLVSYPGDAAADGDAQSAPPSAAAQGGEAAGTPADSDEAASAAARRAAADAALERKLDAVPAEPGVYLLRDRAGAAAGKALGKVLYVGKAKSLRSRVRAYFREGGDDALPGAFPDEAGRATSTRWSRTARRKR